MKALLVGCLVVGSTIATLSGAEATSLDLAGTWRFQLDPADIGMGEEWFRQVLRDEIQLPGSLTAQGYGDEPTLQTHWTGSIKDPSWAQAPEYEPYQQPGQVKFPFWLQPDRTYQGAAWYQREIELPPDWVGGRIALTFERPHWETRVWWDDQPLGDCASLSTAHEYEVPSVSSAGPHRITVRVDNRMIVDVGENAHSVTDHTQGNWNGIVGELTLRRTSDVWIDNVQVYPNLEEQKIRVRVTIGSGEAGDGSLELQVAAVESTDPPFASRLTPVHWGQGATKLDVEYPLGPAMQLWDEFHPNLYRLQVALRGKETDASDARALADSTSVRFGVRQLGTDGTQFVLNGRKVFFRGTLECCIFPLTGHPPTEVDAWRRIIRICKAHGLNHIRFHSWCPPEAAFVAADELGFYYHVECGAWARIGEGAPIDEWLHDETARILRAYGNHPSFLLLAYGNEPGGPQRGSSFLRPWCRRWKAEDPRRLFTSGAGWPLIEESDFHSTPEPRLQQWGGGLRSGINSRPPSTDFDFGDFVLRHNDKPTISHEIGQWCVYPDFNEIGKYTGLLKAKNFEVFRDMLQRHNMLDQAQDFLMASGKLQTLCYKADIEAALRTRGFGGFQLLDLHDFPGQGTALVGVLDAFWDSKPYVTPAEYARFAGPTVLLARLSQRTFRKSDTLVAQLEIAHFGVEPIASAQPCWRLVDAEGTVVRKGDLPSRAIPLDNGIPLGEIQIALDDLAAPARYKLVTQLKGMPVENDWDVWVYPDELPDSETDSVYVTHTLDDAAQQRLAAGGKVLLLAPPATVQGGVAMGFSSIFWNTAWTSDQPPHTLGILCRPEHPVFRQFPTEYHSNWQWWEIVHNAGAMVLDDLPPALRPLVQPIDTWFKNRRLGSLVEAKVLGGSLMICSMDLSSELSSRLVAHQFRYSLLQYMQSPQFAPSTEVTMEAVQGLFQQPTVLQSWGATIRTDSHQPGYEAERAIDGDPRTIWHSRWELTTDGPPCFLLLDLKATRDLRGVRYLARGDMTNGRIAAYKVYVSDQIREWGEPVATGWWRDTSEWQVTEFPAVCRGRYVKLLAESEVNGRPYASAAELDVIVAD